jgi:hypothetical protein
MTPAGQLVNLANGHTVVDRLFVADSFAARLWGLQFRPSLAAGDGLLLYPCNSIHTCCMRFALDLACCRAAQVCATLADRDSAPGHLGDSRSLCWLLAQS